MDGDFSSQEKAAPDPDISRLPTIESIRAVLVRFKVPVSYADGPERKKATEAIEFQVTTSEDFPDRAASPALFLGREVVSEGKRTDERKYVFWAFGKRTFEAGTPIAVGWFGSGNPEPKPTKFDFKLEGEEER